MIRIRSEKKQTLARVRELMKRSEDILSFDKEAEEGESESMKKSADDLMQMHEEDASALDEELSHLNSWIRDRLQVAKEDKAELKERRDEQTDSKEDKFKPVYDRQMLLKTTTHKSAVEMLTECHKKIDTQQARERKKIKEMKDKYESQIGALNLKFEKQRVAHESLQKVNP